MSKGNVIEYDPAGDPHRQEEKKKEEEDRLEAEAKAEKERQELRMASPRGMRSPRRAGRTKRALSVLVDTGTEKGEIDVTSLGPEASFLLFSGKALTGSADFSGNLESHINECEAAKYLVRGVQKPIKFESARARLARLRVEIPETVKFVSKSLEGKTTGARVVEEIVDGCDQLTAAVHEVEAQVAALASATSKESPGASNIRHPLSCPFRPPDPLGTVDTMLHAMTMNIDPHSLPNKSPAGRAGTERGGAGGTDGPEGGPIVDDREKRRGEIEIRWGALQGCVGSDLVPRHEQLLRRLDVLEKAVGKPEPSSEKKEKCPPPCLPNSTLAEQVEELRWCLNSFGSLQAIDQAEAALQVISADMCALSKAEEIEGFPDDPPDALDPEKKFDLLTQTISSIKKPNDDLESVHRQLVAGDSLHTEALRVVTSIRAQELQALLLKEALTTQLSALNEVVTSSKENKETLDKWLVALRSRSPLSQAA